MGNDLTEGKGTTEVTREIFTSEFNSTLNKLCASQEGIKDYLLEVESDPAVTNVDQDTISSTPIPPEMLPEDDISYELTSETQMGLSVLLEAINQKETALEYPFCILGKIDNGKVSADRLETLFKSSDQLQGNIVFYDKDKFNRIIEEISNDPNNVIILCHTHPNASEEIKQQTLTAKLDKGTKDKYKIKDPGLNLSVQDIHQVSSLANRLEGKVKVFGGVLIHNGDFNLIRTSENKVQRKTLKVH